jgi:hypothetical protein
MIIPVTDESNVDTLLTDQYRSLASPTTTTR